MTFFVFISPRLGISGPSGDTCQVHLRMLKLTWARIAAKCNRFVYKSNFFNEISSCSSVDLLYNWLSSTRSCARISDSRLSCERKMVFELEIDAAIGRTCASHFTCNCLICDSISIVSRFNASTEGRIWSVALRSTISSFRNGMGDWSCESEKR